MAIRTGDALDRHVLIHADSWTFVVYMRICDALHPFSSGTVGSIWAQSLCLKPFITFSLICRSAVGRKRSVVWLRVIQHLLLPNSQSQKVKYFVVFARIVKTGSPLADI